MKKSIVLITLCLLTFFGATAQQKKAVKNPKIIVITLDGFRWQELFTGADSKLISNKKYVEDTTAMKEKFWRNTAVERRGALMPFFWNEVVKMGQFHGNRNQGSNVNLTNSMWFSYPGYNEILTGSADDIRIKSNDKFNNPNMTVLEKINNLSEYKGKVAAFGSWDVFPFIINEERAGITVNAGFEVAKEGKLSPREMFLNELQSKVPSPWDSVRFDAFTSNYALEYMKKEHPELVYISYGETDDFAHDGNYQAYLNSAHASDGLIQELWKFTQKDSFYKDNTIFIISTDHGRGTEPLDDWRSHGSKIKGADQVWLVAFGSGIQTLGEVTTKEQLYSNQIAPTVLQFFDSSIKDDQMKGQPLDILKK
ncbi:phosphopentomutase/2,3-bisphosphoglycerate-independent phosphoglycerate mutase family metalloenzyme [Flavobacterium sp. 1]|uniref:alkaline phosphatase family protein n=1 Tax=Flavobacterium sp. 1 TaxID=2035200 RepID=UPI000C250022|nr:alkaline phosphatase family protein [Flavobacterium sp. 1]PJJ07818.1 phosphopentomutase/2,3-bisphosphoglycerate-independent phosphoglycerate mutase family metalloenzyme [Flavobacterium sp. 1]